LRDDGIPTRRAQRVRELFERRIRHRTRAATNIGSGEETGFLVARVPERHQVLAVAYWTDHDTLHYVTRTKEQKQIPISAVDRDLTDQLNQERGLEFRIPSEVRLGAIVAATRHRILAYDLPAR
jgi:hypothetical protein